MSSSKSIIHSFEGQYTCILCWFSNLNKILQENTCIFNLGQLRNWKNWEYYILITPKWQEMWRDFLWKGFNFHLVTRYGQQVVLSAWQQTFARHGSTIVQLHAAVTNILAYYVNIRNWKLLQTFLCWNLCCFTIIIKCTASEGSDNPSLCGDDKLYWPT